MASKQDMLRETGSGISVKSKHNEGP
jgi:hypothetical protein